MIELIHEGDITTANLTEWLALRAALIQYSRGFLCLAISELNSALMPEVLDGSRFELDERVYITRGNTTPDMTGISSNRLYYLYAQNTPQGFRLFWDSATPLWTPRKGGFYSGTARALVKAAIARKSPVSASLFSNKVILEREDSIQRFNPLYVPVPNGEVLLLECAPGDMATTTVGQGRYRIDLLGGRGGANGAGAAADAPVAASYKYIVNPSPVSVSGFQYIAGFYQGVSLRCGLDGVDGESAELVATITDAQYLTEEFCVRRAQGEGEYDEFIDVPAGSSDDFALLGAPAVYPPLTPPPEGLGIDAWPENPNDLPTTQGGRTGNYTAHSLPPLVITRQAGGGAGGADSSSAFGADARASAGTPGKSGTIPPIADADWLDAHKNADYFDIDAHGARRVFGSGGLRQNEVAEPANNGAGSALTMVNGNPYPGHIVRYRRYITTIGSNGFTTWDQQNFSLAVPQYEGAAGYKGASGAFTSGAYARLYQLG